MATRAAFLDALSESDSTEASSSAPSSAPHHHGGGSGGAAGPGSAEHAWALDVVDSGENTNYVALARARARAIAARVHDLHHVFSAYRRALHDETIARLEVEARNKVAGLDGTR